MVFTGVGKVWDAKKKAILCTFDAKGVLNTEDSYIISRLQEMGYKEVDATDVVSIDICNSVNVDWRERYEQAKAEAMKLRSDLVAIKRAYAELEQKLVDIEETMDVPVSSDKTVDEAVDEIQSDNYDVDGELLPKEFETMNAMKLKAFLSRHGYDMKKIRAYTKDETIAAINKLLTEKGLVD